VTLLLDNRPMEGIHVQPVPHNGRNDAGHFLGSEGEDIPVLPHE